MSDLNWNREALDNGDGPPTIVAYDDEGNELFYCKKIVPFDQWQCHISFGPKRMGIPSKRIPKPFPDRESAEKICECFHELAEINHGYD